MDNTTEFSNRRKPKKYTYKKLKHAIENSAGVKLRICEKLGMCRRTLELCLKKWPDLEDTLEEAKERITDMYEITLHEKAIKEKDIKAIIFYLRHSKEGRKRGYGFGYEVQQANTNQLLAELSSRIERGGEPIDISIEDSSTNPMNED